MGTVPCIINIAISSPSYNTSIFADAFSCTATPDMYYYVYAMNAFNGCRSKVIKVFR